MTVRELAARMDADELADWLAVVEIEQDARDRQDLEQTVTHNLINAG